MDVRVEGQAVEAACGETAEAVLRGVLSGKKFKAVVAARALCGGSDRLLDLSSPLPTDCLELSPVYADSPEGLVLIRHSAAHVMAAAVKKLFPGARVSIGPAVENGFYYDFDVERPFSDEDFPAIEEEMHRLIDARLPFVRESVTKEEALRRFRAAGEQYKTEIIEGIDADTVSLYACGDFVDLCRGPHVPHTGFAAAIKLLSVAGAYWRGDEKNKMLSRIYGTAFADDKALAAWLKQQEEARRRDHRKLGRELEFFAFQEDVAPGMVFWLPKGMLMRAILEDFWRKEHLKRGYDMVQGPQLLRVETWQKSGHYEHYRENMYFTSIEKDAYGIKPMNCIAHMLVYKNGLRSYRDLPQRYFELGVVHRHEKSGVLHGLLRVRQFTQDDAHILCAPDQLEDEILAVIHLIRDLMELFGFEYKVAVSTRPESSIGTDEAWETATSALIQAVEKAGLSYEINAGDGAFYGPKIDVRLLDCIGREWQCSTIQVDFTLPERFDLTYTGRDGARRRPVMVHRAIMGSLERFIGVLIEHYAGALPVWLAPEQARVLTVTEAGDAAARRLREELAAAGIRINTDTRNEKLGFKVREAQMAKTPYMLIVGEKEAQAGGANVRLRNGENLGLRSAGEIAALVRTDAEEPFKQGGMRYSFA
ncbi:MAG: threonine--tRNA ligase [Desulfovibrio sp.]|jgi:threonyl-tRNA synthetase|nr:threonine--tRNA ligase [Desulfovibrio sp.]